MKYSPGFIRKNLHTRVRVLASFLLCLILAGPVLQPAAAENGEKIIRVGWYESSFNMTDSFGRRSGYAYE